jgi:N-acyl amino acid synthase of PEP-CTERM/exosortase system
MQVNRKLSLVEGSAAKEAADLRVVEPSAHVSDASIYALYHQTFESIIATTDDIIDECYKLRFQTYCEAGNSSIAEYERDAYDGSAVHILQRHRQSGRLIGTMRLILDQKDSNLTLPALALAEDNHIFLSQRLYTQPIAEVSRFCISKEFRRRVTDTAYASAYSVAELEQLPNRVMPYMALGLIKTAFDVCKQHQIRQCCAVMDAQMLAMMEKLGINFLVIGDIVDSTSDRQLAYITNTSLHQSLLKDRPDILELMTDCGNSPLIY